MKGTTLSLSLCLTFPLSQLPVCFLSPPRPENRLPVAALPGSSSGFPSCARPEPSHTHVIPEPQMVGVGLRGLDFIKALTLIIVNCREEEKASSPPACAGFTHGTRLLFVHSASVVFVLIYSPLLLALSGCWQVDADEIRPAICKESGPVR